MLSTTDHDPEWVSDTELGLSHLRNGWGGSGATLCGVVMWGADSEHAKGKFRCSMCRDMDLGTLPRWSGR